MQINLKETSRWTWRGLTMVLTKWDRNKEPQSTKSEWEDAWINSLGLSFSRDPRFSNSSRQHQTHLIICISSVSVVFSINRLILWVEGTRLSDLEALCMKLFWSLAHTLLHQEGKELAAAASLWSEAEKRSPKVTARTTPGKMTSEQPPMLLPVSHQRRGQLCHVLWPGKTTGCKNRGL